VPCFCAYDWTNLSQVIVMPNPYAIGAILGYMAAPKGVVGAVRLPLTASYWLDVNLPSTYPHIGAQYRALISNVVGNFTSAGVVVILDLHWNDDVTTQQAMALKGTANAVDFWKSIASEFGTNQLVFYELYNEPHIDDFAVFVGGNSTYAGMMEMYAAVRAHAPDSMVIIAGQTGYAYNASSLVRLEAEQGSKLHNVMFNFHPYMGPMQQGDSSKSAAGFDAQVAQVLPAGRPVIVTEFGQYCCARDGACFAYPGTWKGAAMGYVEAILQICSQRNVSWLGWAWRPQAEAANCDGPDMNGENGNTYRLSSASGGQGANWARLFATYFNASLV